MTNFIAISSLILALAATSLAGESCSFCHVSVRLSGVHKGVPCLGCHISESVTVADPGGTLNGAIGCKACHKGHERIFVHAMAKRSGEKEFVSRSYGKVDALFWEKNCTGCHLQSCSDCHGSGHNVIKPLASDCQKCHKGYFTGWDYSGRAPREDNNRYQRGAEIEGEKFLKMLPDVHFQRGMECSACHSMQSFMDGRKSSKNCRDCHKPDLKIIEHSIKAHMERLECYACHAAWGAQEYGTFYLRFRNGASREDFDLKAGKNGEYLRSAYLKSQGSPMLGLNSFGKVSPIRPMLIAYYTDILTARSGGEENRLLATEWRAWMPHTIRRGAVPCEGCHDSPRRFLFEAEKDRIFLPEKDGMTLKSFWQQQGQKVVNGEFMPLGRYQKMNERTMTRKRAETRKWQNFLRNVETSSKP